MPPKKQSEKSTTEPPKGVPQPPKPIVTKAGFLNYREAARQIRSIEQATKAKSAICNLGYNAKLKAKAKAVRPAVIEIRAPEKPTKPARIVRKKKSEQTISTISSEVVRTSPKKRPWANDPCELLKQQRELRVGPSSTTVDPNALDSHSSGSNYRGWITTVPICLKSETTSSCAEAAPSLKTSEVDILRIPRVKKRLSEELADTAHASSGMRLKKDEPVHRPCKASIQAGAPPRYTGTCPPTLEQIAKMSKERQKFFLTQDPRRTRCLINPDFLRSRKISEAKEFKTFSNVVKTSENLCLGKKIEQPEPIICETIDLENPLGLDFQGLDYKNTYEGDEQDLQNIRVYRRLCRHMDRKRAKIETAEKVEEDLQNERLRVPDRFAVKDRDDPEDSESVDSVQLGKLYRSQDKPKNKRRIVAELKLRRDHYKDLYLRRKARQEKRDQKAQLEADAAQKVLGATIALNNFDAAVHRIDDAITLAVKGEVVQERKEAKRRKFPHTIHETTAFKQKLKYKNRIERDRALIKREFYLERKGTEKDYPELHYDVGDEKLPCEQEFPEISHSESSDDEDNMEVGKAGKEFMLRGFHFKLGQNMRGKLHQREKNLTVHKEKGCVTRDQWLNELAPKKRHVKLDVKVGIVKERTPDDPQFEIFQPERGKIKIKTKTSAVKEFVQQRLGRHYDRSIRSKLKIKPPRLPYNVKKFNLIRFLYSENDRRLEAMRNQEMDKDLTIKPLSSTLEYIHEQDAKRKAQKEIEKQERMRLLGIPCVPPNVKVSEIRCEASSTDNDSDWVPEREPDVDGKLEDYEKRMTLGFPIAKVPMSKMGNMPAPEYRECTLRRHPRHPRDYDTLRVPSELFHEAVQTTGAPHMHKLNPDQRMFENVKLPERPYTQIFQARHHHDHWNPIQTDKIDVQYQPKVIKPEITRERLNQIEQVELKRSFEKARPECTENINKELSRIVYDFRDIIDKHHAQRKKTGKDRSTEQLIDRCKAKPFVHHSREPGELDNVNYPGRKEYLHFLNDIRATLEEKKKAAADKEERHLCVDKDAYIEELEEDLKSIESCLTSKSSSICSNLTNDSGSFLLMEGAVKVPLDYIRKSVVPFDELQRSRFHAIPIDCEAEEGNPFRMMPFSGQKRAQASISSAKDNFFTFTTRLRNGLRLRLETPIIDVRKLLIGRGKNKYFGAVTTDIDENYITELKNRPTVKHFNFKSGRDFIKNALRLKFESMVIQGQLVRAKIYDRLNELHWQAMQKTKTLYEQLFAKWEKKEYESAMSVVYKVKSFYEITDTLRNEFRILDQKLTVLNMDIVFIEGIWIRRVMLQNFHYLLGDREWRNEHDWIHRILVKKKRPDDKEEIEKYELEGFAQSIANRSRVNIRNREKDDAWAIKSYYEDIYLPNKHPILIVFPHGQSFLDGIEYLKMKTFMLLLELHLTMSVHTELQGRLQTFEEWCMQELKEKEDYVMRKCSKKYFMEDRADELKRRTLDYLEGPIEESFNDLAFNEDRSVIIEVWRQMVPATLRGAGNQDIDPCDMVAMMSDVVINLIAAFEKIPMRDSRILEARLRRRRAYLRKQSKAAYQNEIRIDIEMRKVRSNLLPPYEKQKPTGKLKRTRLKKIIPPKVIHKVHVSEHTKFFFRAFHDEGDVMIASDARDSIIDVNTMQDQIVPFYFDHFLKINGYNVNYNFKTQAEQRDGPEIERLHVKTLIPQVMEKMDKWENLRKKVMEENIAHNPKMYENVNF